MDLYLYKYRPGENKRFREHIDGYFFHLLNGMVSGVTHSMVSSLFFHDLMGFFFADGTALWNHFANHPEGMYQFLNQDSQECYDINCRIMRVQLSAVLPTRRALTKTRLRVVESGSKVQFWASISSP